MELRKYYARDRTNNLGSSLVPVEWAAKGPAPRKFNGAAKCPPRSHANQFLNRWSPVERMRHAPESKHHGPGIRLRDAHKP